MTEIYLIRHTQAEGNRYRIMQGHWDGDVTALGRQQIELLAERFRTVPVDAAYSSDLYRARLTAGAITRWKNLPLHTDARLREINVGPWETKFFGNVFHDDPERTELFLHDPERFTLPGAETFAEVGERAYAALLDIVRANPGRTVAIVSHGVTVRCLVSRITGISLKDTAALPICGNTAVTHLHGDGASFTVDTYNDTSHLDAIGGSRWGRAKDVRHVPLDPVKERDFYEQCYADAWRGVHGSLDDFDAGTYSAAAAAHHRADPDSVLRMLAGEETIGLVDMDTRRGAVAGYGWLSLLYLKPEYRRQGYGIQVLARAYRHYQELGRRSLRLNVATANTAARAFYEKEGFRLLRKEGSGLLLLEKSLGGPRNG